MSFKFENILNSSNINSKLQYFEKMPKPNQKILKILVEATMKAKSGGYGAINITGTFTDNEYKLMKFYMEKKDYNVWISENGYTFTPVTKEWNPIGNFLSDWRNKPWEKSQFGGFGEGFSSGQGGGGFDFKSSSENHNNTLLLK